MKQRFGLFALCLLSASGLVARTAPWTVERARAWYEAQPWIRGCNYMPSGAANHFDTWQAYGAEERFAQVERELALAEEIGFNTIRVVISAEWGFAAWHLEHDSFMVNFERMLTIAARHGIRVVPVLGNDCARPKELWQLPTPGPQKFDIGYHGGRKRTQHGSDPEAVGFTALDDPALRPRFYAMCRELLSKYKDDDRILFWDLWNEPGNANRGERTLKDMRELFEIAWEIDPKQPLAADVWRGNFGTGAAEFGPQSDSHARTSVQILAGSLSDIISYHLYEGPAWQKRVIAALRKRWQRPLVNTEWLRRTNGDEPSVNYPLFAEERVGCLCWGFVNGKYQTHEPYEPHWKDKFTYAGDPGDVTRWFHDLFRPSHHPYDPYEIVVIRHTNIEMDDLKPSPHPRLLADARDFAELKTKLETTALGRLGREHLLAEAEAALSYGLPERKLDASGRRILAVSTCAVDLIGKCAMAYRLTGEVKYARRAIREAMVVSAFSDWNPSHFLDTAEMAFAVALCYDWLYDVLTPTERETLGSALHDKALALDVEHASYGWWLGAPHNWNQVCNGGLVAAAVATAERNPELSKRVIRRAERTLPLAMAAFAPNGAFPEGPAGYWEYALNYNAMAIAAIEKFLGCPSPLAFAKGFRQQAFLPDACTGPTGLMFNFSDSTQSCFSPRGTTFASWWLAKRFDAPETLVCWEKGRFEAKCREPISEKRLEWAGNRFFPLMLLALQEVPTGVANLPLCRVIDGTNPIAVMRTSWSDANAWFVGVKGGSPSQNHGHMDVGSFVLDALGVRWSYDLGCEKYARIEKAGVDLWYMGQNSQRWTLFRYAPEGHSTVQVGGARQVVAKKAEFTERPEGFPAKTTLDLSYLYDGLGRASRSFILEKEGGLAIVDSLDLEGDKPVVWRMNTKATARLEGNRAILSQPDGIGRTRQLEVTADAADIRWEFKSVAEPRGQNDSPNPGMNQLFFSVRPQKAGYRRWRIVFKEFKDEKCISK